MAAARTPRARYACAVRRLALVGGSGGPNAARRTSIRGIQLHQLRARARRRLQRCTPPAGDRGDLLYHGRTERRASRGTTRRWGRASGWRTGRGHRKRQARPFEAPEPAPRRTGELALTAGGGGVG